MRHTKYENVWGIGDCTNTPTSKTAAAVFAQAPALVHNLIKTLDKNKPNASYTGYASCPIYLGDNKLMLCEFKYGKIPDETFSKNQGQPSSLAFYMVRYLMPRAYWGLAPKGKWYGSRTIFKPKFD